MKGQQSIGAGVFVLILILITSIVFFTDVALADNPILNSSSCGEIGTRIYEFYNIDFNSVEGKFLIYTNKSSTGIFYRKSEIIDIWDVRVTIDGKPYSFIPRLSIGDLGQNSNKTYFANYTVPLSGNMSHTIVIEFTSNNVKEIISKHLYPFDAYQFSQMRNIENGMSRISHYALPTSDIESSASVKGNATYYIPGERIPPVVLDMPERVIQNKNEIITGEFGIKDNKICGVSIHVAGFRNESGEIIIGDIKEAEVFDFPVTEYHSITFRRSFFPSIFLFVILVAFVILLSLHYLKESRTKIEAFYKIYIQASLPIILAEFTVGILPPSRPLTLTLFDMVIFIPILILLIKRKV